MSSTIQEIWDQIFVQKDVRLVPPSLFIALFPDSNID
jgi:hypothetical protein